MTVYAQWKRNLDSDQGSVGILIALAMFIVMGMLTMTFNTVQLSKEKIRLQNAADAAALEHAVWQARGMNQVQNINDEAYTCCQTASVMLKFAAVTETAAKVVYAIPFIGPALAQVLHFAALIVGGISGILTNIVVSIVLNYTSQFYAKGSALIGYIAAQQLAAMNGAQGILPWSTEILGLHLGFFALGFSPHIKDTFVLPLTRETSSKSPLTKQNEALKKTFELSSWAAAFRVFGVGNNWKWLPFVSDKPKSGEKLAHFPEPVVWIAMKWKNSIHTLPLGHWSPSHAECQMHGSPMFAMAAAQCICGDVIVHNKKTESDKTNQRPAGFGVGATAKLVPVAETVSNIPLLGSKIGKALHYVVWH